MQDDHEENEDIVGHIMELLEKLYYRFEFKIHVRTRKRGAYMIESERFLRSFLYKCGHRDARNFAIYVTVPEGGYSGVYCTRNEGDWMCISCAIRYLDFG